MSKLAWWRFWFQVHKWIGLILAIVIIPVCLTGSALVWHDALDRMVNPSRYAVSGETMLRADAYAAAARAVLKPGERVAQMTMPEDGGPVIVAAAQPPA
ncbi:MAG TPA: PepSY domain-containing protein, partial [Sphingomonas sp.]